MLARELLEEARRAAVRLEELTRTIQEGPAKRPSEGPAPKGAVGDPTARGAEWVCVTLPALMCELDACGQFVGDAMRLIEGVRKAMGARYADVLDAYYIGGLKWQEVGDRLDISAMAAIRRRDVACDWVDATGFARANAGEGFAE